MQPPAKSPASKEQSSFGFLLFDAVVVVVIVIDADADAVVSRIEHMAGGVYFFGALSRFWFSS